MAVQINAQPFLYNKINQKDGLMEVVIMWGIFGELFDFNDDGKLDLFERASELAFLEELMKEEKEAFDLFDDMENDF